MMNDSDFKSLVEASWRRPLTEEELTRLTSWLELHPQARSEWESEVLLNQCLHRLPDAPLPSNFTSLVMQAVAREQRTSARSAPSGWQRLFRWPLLRLGWSLLVVALGWGAYAHYQSVVRKDLTKGLTVLANVERSNPAILQDFDAIWTLGQASPSDDDELFAVLSQ